LNKKIEYNKRRRNMKTEYLKEFAGYFFSGEILRKLIGNIFSSTKEKVAEKAGETLKSSILGIGDIDEILALEAVYIAQKDLGVKKTDISKIAKLILNMPLGARNKVIGILGKNEQEFTVFIPDKDKEGNVIQKKVISKGNLRGARFIELLANQDDDQERMDLLQAFGATVTFWDRAEDIWKHFSKKLEKFHQTADNNKTIINALKKIEEATRSDGPADLQKRMAPPEKIKFRTLKGFLYGEDLYPRQKKQKKIKSKTVIETVEGVAHE
jgi:hypothetical protein